MADPPSAGATPPEVPEEFAAAYRAAYEQALAAQSVPEETGGHADRRRHRERPPFDDEVETGDGSPEDVDLPERTRPIAIGTHRQPEEYDDAAPTRFERVRDSGWLVPVLLGLLALLLILGAYVGGRSFADHVAHGSGAPAPHSIIRGA